MSDGAGRRCADVVAGRRAGGGVGEGFASAGFSTDTLLVAGVSAMLAGG